MNKLSSERIHTLGTQFLGCKDLRQICLLLQVDEELVKFHSIFKKYSEFKIPKKDGFRQIEAPDKELMRLLRRFNVYLQAAYYVVQTPVAFGFIVNAKNETRPKNILENARMHLGHKYMMKLDFKDFFHQISKQRIFDMFTTEPFGFDSTAAHFLSNLFTYKNRLPMGAPTSPVLSNFACMDLDIELQNWALNHQITFTHFADDITFSSDTDKFTERHLLQVTDICRKHQLTLNEEKIKFYDATDPKKVTGLVLHETVDIPRQFYDELDDDLIRLKSLVEAGLIIKHYQINDVLLKYKQEVKGKINFIGMIEGYESDIYSRYDQKMKQALSPPDEDMLYARWTHFHYF